MTTQSPQPWSMIFALLSVLLGFAAPARAAVVGLFDTGVASSTPLTGEAVAKQAGWQKLPEDETAHKFKGDAVLANDRLAIVLRPGGPGAEVYGRGTEGWTRRTVLTPAVANAKVKLAGVAIVENSPDTVTVDAAFQSSDQKTIGLRYELGIGQVFVKTEPHGDVAGLRIAAPGRFAVLPDFFADDMVVDAATIPAAEAELPSENFLLHLLSGGEAIVMSVAKTRDRDARITLSGDGPHRVIDGSEVYYGKDGAIWVAVLEGRGIWHQHEVAAADAGRVLPLEWTAPFPAQWRVDWRRTDTLTSSWEMITETPRGDFEKHPWFGNADRLPADRHRWTTVLGSFAYPCWIDQGGRGHLQPLKRTPVTFDGPTLIYPINRIKPTPLDRFTVVDVMRATLGVGPCEYVLDVEGQGTSMKGRATCATRDLLNGIYAARQQKLKRAEIEKGLVDVLVFVRHIRGRIEDYVTFGHQILAYLQQQKAAHPELAESLGEMETLTRAIDRAVAARREKIKTPAYVAELTEKFRTTLVDYEGDDALARCKAITAAIVDVGGNQDELVGECRLAVRVLRQRAGSALAADPRTAELSQEIRRQTQVILRNATHYEAPRQ
jgi:hypothetical protein